MEMILSLTTLVFLLMVQVACYHAISTPIGTSSEIILKSGEEGTLQCGFKGRAQTVSWTYKGPSSKQLLLIELDMLQQIGQRRVYGYGEGRYNISEDFSLIIHEVTDEDEGRYTCKILESITCSLLSNYTFVSVAGMHSEVILKSGEDGTLTCDVKGEAHVVYWTYQNASSKPVLLVRLELFQHQVGQRRIALNTEGRYNITGNFSLIIHDVTLADEGRYTCEILELTGSIVRKHSDVSVPEVKTVPTVLLESGKRATLACGYKRTVYAIYWRYESTTSPMELLVVLDYLGEKSGPGYDEGHFDITDDYSLVIHNVEAKSEGRYTCEVSDFKSGLLLRNHTDVHTIVTAERPFVRIEQCENEVSAEDINAPCFFHTTSDVPSTELTCTVRGAKPLVDLKWIFPKSHDMSEYWKQVMDGSTFTEKARGDGIFDQTLTVYVGTSFFTSDIQHFTCVAEGLAVDGKASFTISVYLTQGVNVKPTVVMVVLSVVCILLFTFPIMGVLWKVRLRDKWRSRSAALRKKINKIKDMNADEAVYLGVLGDEDAGKSSFIASLSYLIRGRNDSIGQPPNEGDDAVNSKQIWQCTEAISEGLRIRKMRDKRKFKPEEIPTILKSAEGHETDIESSSHGINMETSDLIHLPIFVFDISNKEDLANRIWLLNELSCKISFRIGEYPMIVLTKGSATAHEKELKELMKKIWIPRKNILVTLRHLDATNFNNHERGELLDFILKCVATANMQKSIKNRLMTRRKRNMRYTSLLQSEDTAVL